MNISDFLKIYKILINWFQTTRIRKSRCVARWMNPLLNNVT